MEEWVQTRSIIPQIIENLRENNVMRVFRQQPIGDWNDIINRMASQQPWALYGSNNNITESPMSLTKVILEIKPSDYEESIIPETDGNLRKEPSVNLIPYSCAMCDKYMEKRRFL